MAQQSRVTKVSAGRRATTALVIAGALGLAGCSSVPDAINPVEWYRGASDTVGGWFGDDEPIPAEPGRATAGDPGSSPGTAYPNLATVPPRPTPSTTAAERDALRQGLVADRTNARYTDQPAQASAPAATAPQPGAQASVAPAPERQAAVPPPAAEPAAPAAAPSRASSSGEGSNLWPNRPPPETPGLRASTSGRVGGGIVHNATPAPAAAPVPERRAPQAEQTASRTTLDSAGSAARTPPPASREAGSIRAPAPEVSNQPSRQEPSASSQSVIVNEDAIGGSAPATVSFSGRRYLASTIYFGHGSARLTDAERQTIAEIARTAAANGAAVQVIGHASARTAELALRDHELANFTISLKRAQAVADVLVRGGLPADRLQVEALGDAQPEFYEVMPSGEAGNRRVEIVLIY
ncbi:OmpA family protein [Thalassobaculum sp.]|uniref:OmpA family protein n=1 Tax=Thalassobaculum sp. TaxID=2022740 RepID=UPI0032EE0327